MTKQVHKTGFTNAFFYNGGKLRSEKIFFVNFDVPYFESVFFKKKNPILLKYLPKTQEEIV